MDGQPVYQDQVARTNKGPVFAQPKVITGIDLNPENRAAISANIQAGLYGKTGDIFKNTENNPRGNAADFTPGYSWVGSAVLDRSANRTSQVLREESSPRLAAVEKAIGFSSRYQEGVSKRQGAYENTISYLSLNDGKSYESLPKLSPLQTAAVWTVPGGPFFFQRSRYVAATLATAPAYGPSIVADASVNAGVKSYVFTGALITPETSAAAKQEIGAGTKVFGKVYSEPSTYVYGFTGGIAKGTVDIARQRTPVSVQGGPTSFVADAGSFKPGTVGFTGSTKGTAVATYRYGPFNLFKRTEVVPTEGGFILSGSQAVRSTALVSVESVNSAVVRGKPYFSSENWQGTLNLRSGRLSLQDSNGQRAYISQPGRSSPVASDIRTSPSQFAIFERNKYGQYQASQYGVSRGLSESVDYSQVGVTKGNVRTGDVRITNALFSAKEPSSKSLSRIPAGKQYLLVEQGSAATKNNARYAGSVRTSNVAPSGGAPFKMTRAGFNDLRTAGYYSDPSLSVPLRSKIGSALSRSATSRRGELRFATGADNAQVYRPNTKGIGTIGSAPSMAGLPGGRFAVPRTGRPLFFAPGVGQNFVTETSSGSASSIVFQPVSGVGFRPDVSSDRKPSFTVIPGLSSLAGSRSVSGVRADQTPRYDIIPRLDVSQRQDPVNPVTPGSPVPPPFVPPIVPPMVLPAFGVGRGGGDSRGRNAKYGYAPSLSAVAFDVRGDTSQRQFTGFEVRPLQNSSKRRKKR